MGPSAPHDRGRGRPAPAGGRVRPRYGRITAAGGAVAVTLVAALGGAGLIPAGSGSAPTAARQPVAVQMAHETTLRQPSPDRGAGAASPTADTAAATHTDLRRLPSSKPAADRTDGQQVAPSVPPASGTGRRVVFDIADQRVWLVAHTGGRDVVQRTYLVSGSLTDNLGPGTYSVYSRSLHAVGIDDSGTMMYMVRFAHGPNAAIGFHDIPVLDGSLVQSRDQLGSPQSHGCIRQWRPDAQALWRFASTGTKVVVV